jgi:hypothetical protein
MAIVCGLINSPFAFNCKSLYVGDFTYVEASTGLTKINHLYVITLTDVASSKEGTIVTIALFVIRDIFTLVVGIVLNVILIIQMRKYLIERAKTFSLNNKNGRNVVGIDSANVISNSAVHQNDLKTTHLANEIGYYNFHFIFPE